VTRSRLVIAVVTPLGADGAPGPAVPPLWARRIDVSTLEPPGSRDHVALVAPLAP